MNSPTEFGEEVLVGAYLHGWTEGSFVACAVSGVLGGISLLFTEKAVVGIVLIGLGFVLSGISILFYYGCKIATRGIILLTKKLALSVKKCFVRKDKYNG